jgi:hypothetical protein
MWHSDVRDALDRDRDTGADQGKTYEQCSDRLRLTMSVGVILVGRLDREPEAKGDNEGTDYIAKRLDAVGNESKGMADNASHAFQD